MGVELVGEEFDDVDSFNLCGELDKIYTGSPYIVCFIKAVIEYCAFECQDSHEELGEGLGGNVLQELL